MTENKKLDALSKKMFDALVKRNPIWATYLGLHKYDSMMPKETRESYLKDIKRYESFLKRFENINPEKLTPDRKIDRDAAIHQLKLFLFYTKEVRYWESNPDLANRIGDAIFPLFVKDFAPFKKRIVSITSRLEKVPRFLEEGKTRIKTPVRLWTEMAIESCDRLPGFFDEIMKESKRRKLDKKTLGRLESAINTANESIKNYKKYLKKIILPKSKKEFAIGDKKFRKLIKLRGLGYTPKEILRFGKRQLKDSKRKLKVIAGKIKPRASVETVKKIIEKKRPKTFGGTLKAYRKSVKSSKEFIVKKDIATMPKNEELKVIATPVYMRHFIPFAAYFQPAKFDKKQLGIYIVTPSEKGNVSRYNYPNIENTSVHEGYPGHHLQLSCANTNPSLVRLLDHATEFVEGWAHYCEEYMKEIGYGDTLEQKFIQIKDQIWRAARIIIDVKLSTGKMSYNEAIKFLMKHANMDKEGATAEVKRYTQSPSYQLSYLLGKHMIKQLKADVKKMMKKEGKEFTDKFFHDTLLYSGSLPIYFMRKIFEEKIKGKN
jgi:uncharacterized protein (DUF885 family)